MPLKNQFKIEEEQDESFDEKEIKTEKEIEQVELDEELEVPNIPLKVLSPEEDVMLSNRERSSSIDRAIFQESTTSEGKRLTSVKTLTPLDDDAEIVIQTGTTGWGFAMIGDNQEYGQFTWTSAGVVTLIANSANTVNTDTDAKFCIYDAGSGIAIKNRLGSTLILRYELNYR